MLTTRASLHGIAIIGMAGKFPGAANVEEYWNNLCAGTESIRSLSEEELKAAGTDPALLSDPYFVKRGAVLDGADQFDAAFFEMVAKEAEVTDPQQRIFLECAHEALEDAGYDPQQFAGQVGVFGGAGRNTYVNHLYKQPELVQAVGSYGALIGNDADFLATRAAYKLNLRGPALTVQTACSTSLVAVHLACQSLLTYECDMALAGGVAIKDPQTEGYLYQDGGILSPDGHCRALDAKAQGTVVGNGAGVVLLKRLDEALADGDHIYAVIRGSAVNNDGSQKVGFTAPSVNRQAAVIAEALALAEAEPETITYVEAHGTGTALGDPIEVAALTQAFRESGAEGTGYCALGTVKPNIGHLDAAAGVAGLIKAVLSLQRGQIPPTLHVQEPNLQIDWAGSPFYVNRELQEWKPDGVRRAGVSSFGIGGTNAHVILEEAPAVEKGNGAKEHQLLVVSAKTETALKRAAARLADHLERRPAAELADVAFTLQAGRTLHPHRLALVCRDVPEAVRLLREPDWGGQARVVSASAEPFVVFLFSGQGSQFVNMGQELYEQIPAFREEIDRLAVLAEPYVGCDLRAMLARDELHQTQYAQPALFVTGYALTTLLQAWGVEPQAMIGHSIGEYVAAARAGVLSLEAALEIVAARGRLMQEMPRGAMTAVTLGEQEVISLLVAEQAHLSVAAVNGTRSTVVSGSFEAVERLESSLAALDIAYRRLDTSHAFHSNMMEPMLERFAEVVAGVELRAPQQPYLSNLTGTWITAEQATDPAYYVRHLRETVRFADNLAVVKQEPNAAIVEVGPKQTALAALLETVGQLVLHGVKVDWQAMHAGERRLRLSLPTYPFERQRYYVPTGAAKPFSQAGKLAELSDWFYLPSWKRSAPILETENGHRWLIFLDAHGLGEKLVRRLRDSGEDVQTLAPGEAFADSLMNWRPTRIVFLRSLTEEKQNESFFTLLSIAQVFGEHMAEHRCQIIAVTDQLQDVTDDEVLHPERATLFGAVKVIPQEYSQLRCRTVDVALGANEDRLAGQLCAEFAAAGAEETFVAYRGKHRYVQTFEKVCLKNSLPLRKNGVYLLTGAGHEVGKKFAERLSAAVQARLVLIAEPGTPRPHLGSEHLFFHADVADPAVMNSIVAAAQARFGHLHGVIHAEEVIGSGLIQLKTREAAERVLRPKVQGTLALHEALQGTQLDFFALFSRTISFTGGFGQVDNAAASSFLDAFARSRPGTVAVNWSGWQFDAWQSAQTMILPELQQHLQDLQQRFGLSADEGWEALLRALGSGQPQVVVSTQDFQTALEELAFFHTSAYLSSLQKGATAAARSEGRTHIAPRNEVEAAVAALWQELFQVEQISVCDNFFDLGGNSLLGVQLVMRLRNAFGLDVPMSLLYESPTVEGLAQSIVLQQIEQTELEELEALLEEIETLSAEEARAILTSK
ncbi:acyl transferase domain-containing protein [Tumebacillus sp. BK434]|uniref:type I polyketide synthase n=1 Tax=Tumebacillus sp. BK434 TaxID=2512169 RepID=UPI00104BE41C|nr:type I polyketide synthase [Tumebacillus sp. BK434]TCP59044.1 acyl transferase domain-containing protein [Tumebacillus sp. BK434]